MNSFISWIGGKKLLRDAILARLPPYYEKYIEVFGGAGWVLFRKPPGIEKEIYNDFNSNLVNLYRCVRDKPDKLKYKLRYVLNSREDFDWIAMLHKRKLFPRLRDVDRAAKFYQLIRYSYTYATICIEKGFDPKTLSELLGHAVAAITLNRYCHSSFTYALIF